MRARLAEISSTEVDDLTLWSPGAEFGFLLNVFVAPDDDQGEEELSVMVCSPSWYAKQMTDGEVRSGHGTIFMLEYDHRALRSFIERAVQRAEAPTRHELMAQFGWLLR